MKGACVVLIHPRTGSSLLMQTLAILGMPWVGARHREDLPVEANPRGYLEDRQLLVRGLTPENLRRLGPLDGHALKLDLLHMLAPDRLGQWSLLESEGARLFIPYRHPLESAVSNLAFAPPDRSARDVFIEVTRFLYGYAVEYRTLAARLVRDFPDLPSRTLLVPYTLHLDDPRGFVEAVRLHAGLPENPERLALAVGNIQSSLYRVQVSGLPETQRAWYERMPARRVYETLCSSPRPWEDLLE